MLARDRVARDLEDDLAAERHLDELLAAQAHAVKVLAVAGVANHEAVQIGRRLVEAAKIAAVGREDLHAHAFGLDADVDLAGSAHGDVAVHLPERLAPGRQLQPVGDGLVGLRVSGAAKKNAGECGQSRLQHSALPA